jgi:phosphoribosylformylglycinamidine cyclo-ligase
MNIDDLLCVGATDNILVSSTIGRNKRLIPAEVITAIIQGTDELLSELRQMGIGCHGTGGETADLGDLVRTIVVDSTVSCRMRRTDVIDNSHIQAGDIIIGLASSGQATYEQTYNSGIGSNGLSSARHDLFARQLAAKYPESYDPSIPAHLVYSGSYRPTDYIPETGLDAGRLLLYPTRTYAPVIKALLSQQRPAIHGMVHCTGGAQTKVMHFVTNKRVIKDNLFPLPPLFRLIQEESGTSGQEMYQVCHMGPRMEIYTSADQADQIITTSRHFGIDARPVGHVEDSPNGNELIIESEQGRFAY